jgi:hypothetical protein
MSSKGIRDSRIENGAGNPPQEFDGRGLPAGYRRVLEAKNVKPVDRIWVIPCRKGRRFGDLRAHIYHHGRGLFGYTGVGSGLRRAVLAVPGVRMWQNGDEEFSVIFPEDRFEAVAAVVQPYRKRRTLKNVASGAVSGSNFNERRANVPGEGSAAPGPNLG